MTNGEVALKFVKEGDVVGLGSGRASTEFIRTLGKRVQQGLKIRGVPTSQASAQVAQDVGIPLVSLAEVSAAIDLTVDGADEVDRELNLIKGLGGALVREKVVAACSKQLIILIGPDNLDVKDTGKLGTRGVLPVEVVPFALPLCMKRLSELACPGVVRMAGDKPFVTDNGNHILDCQLSPQASTQALRELEASILAIPGVLGTGMFLAMADVVLVQRGDVVEERLRPRTSAAAEARTTSLGGASGSRYVTDVSGVAVSTGAVTTTEAGLIAGAQSRRLRCFSDREQLAQGAALDFVHAANAAITQRGRFLVALSGGSTPKLLYQRLAEPRAREQVDWSKVHFFWSDERAVSPTHADSNFRLADEALLQHLDVPAANIHRLQGEHSDLVKAARQAQADLARTCGAPPDGLPPALDLVLLGMGTDGHTASLFPRTAAVKEQQLWIMANEVPQLATERLTFTAPLINAARHVWFLITGADKAERLVEVLEGPRDPERLPSQLVQPVRGGLTWYLDQPAGSRLTQVS